MLYASNLNLKIRDARMHITGHWRTTGSVFQQTRRSNMEKIDTRLEVDSDADPELLAAALRNASNGCHAEVAITNPTPLEEELIVNGAEFNLDDYPAKAVRRQPDS